MWESSAATRMFPVPAPAGGGFPGSWPLVWWGGAFLGSKVSPSDKSRLMPEPSALPLDEYEGDSREASAITAQSSSKASSTVLSSSKLLNFEEVYQEHFAFVWRLARRQGVPLEHVDDVCQEVFIVVHRRLSEFEERAKVRTWIYQIVANVVRNQRRSVQRKSVHARSQGNVVDPDELDSHTVSPETTTGRKEAAQAAREILMSMNESQRMAFVLV